MNSYGSALQHCLPGSRLYAGLGERVNGLPLYFKVSGLGETVLKEKEQGDLAILRQMVRLWTLSWLWGSNQMAVVGDS